MASNVHSCRLVCIEHRIEPVAQAQVRPGNNPDNGRFRPGGYRRLRRSKFGFAYRAQFLRTIATIAHARFDKDRADDIAPGYVLQKLLVEVGRAGVRSLVGAPQVVMRIDDRPGGVDRQFGQKVVPDLAVAHSVCRHGFK
jgi:hypothetical protein